MLRKLALLALLAAWAPVCLATQGSPFLTEIPEICANCSFVCSVNVAATTQAADTVYPGHVRSLPIYLYVASGDTVDFVWIKMTADDGLSYDGIDVSGCGWDGLIDSSGCSYGSRFIEIQMIPTTPFPGGSYHHLCNLKLKMGSTVQFNTRKKILFDNTFPIVSGKTPWFCTAKGKGDSLYTINPTFHLRAGTTTTYSYQGLRDTNFYARLPLYFKPNFPVDDFALGIQIPSNMDVVRWEANPTFNVKYLHSQPYCNLVDSGTVIFQPNVEALLGYLIFTGEDYRANYANCHWTQLDNISWWGNGYKYARCESSTQCIYWSQMTSTAGGLNYPVYSCTTSMGEAGVDVDLSIEIPIYADHSFWSQEYEYYIRFNKRCLALEDVIAEEREHQSQVCYSIWRNLGDTTWIKIYSCQVDQDTCYVQPDDHFPIFTLQFTATDSFAHDEDNQTVVGFDRIRDDNWVKDFFQAEGSKIKRESDSTAYFVLNGCGIKNERFFAVSVDTVECLEDSEVSIPFRLDRVTANGMDYLAFTVYHLDYDNMLFLEFRPNEELRFDSVVWNESSAEYDHLECYFPRGTLDNECLIGEFICRIYGAPESFSRIEIQDLNEATHITNGGILPCGSYLLRLSQLPFDYKLKQNYPNPFNSHTIIAFDLPEAGHVSLNIYDLLGRRVRELVDEDCQVGRYQITWDGMSDTDEPISTGVYLYTIEANGFNASQKMTYLK